MQIHRTVGILSITAFIHALFLLFALSPFDLWPLAIFSCICVLYVEEKLRELPLRNTFVLWIVFAIATSFVTFGWIIPTIYRYTGENVFIAFFLSLAYAVLFQTKYLLIFLGLRFLPRPATAGLRGAWLISAIFALSDALSPELFPWSWGNGLWGAPWLRQFAGLGSVYLLSFFVAFCGVLLYRIRPSEKTIKTIIYKSVLKRERALFIFLFLCIGLAALLYYIPVKADGNPVRVLITQTNIGIADKDKRLDKEFATGAINRLFNQSLEGIIQHGDVDLIVWPEAAMPFHSASQRVSNAGIYSETFDAAAEYISRRSHAALIFHDMFRDKKALRSRLSVRPDNLPHSAYFKRRLVPLGEYLPLEKYLPLMRKIFPDAGHFVPGRENTPLDVPLLEEVQATLSQAKVQEEIPWLSSSTAVRAKLPRPKVARILRVKPLLCYEALYPEDAHTDDAVLLINLASDAWFGDELEGPQHASAALLRAVENGVPMVRAAMSGPSAIVDFRGNDLVERTRQATEQNLYAEVSLEKRRTLFSILGMWSFYALMFAFLWPSFWDALKQRK